MNYIFDLPTVINLLCLNDINPSTGNPKSLSARAWQPNDDQGTANSEML